MPVLTKRRGIPVGPVISAIVATMVMVGAACALPAFAATAARSDADPACSTATATSTPPPTTAPPTGDPTATSTSTDGSAGGTDATATDTDSPPASPTTPDCPTTTATTATTTATTAPPSTTAPPTTDPATTDPATTDPVTTDPVIAPTEPSSTFTYIDTPPGNSSVTEPHGTITRAEIITRALNWLAEKVPYSQTEWWTDANGTYRQDCSGYVSMAWDLNQNIDFWTGNLNTVSHTIDPSQLLPGDNLMSVEHTIIFAGWANAAHTTFNFYEEAHPGTFARYVVDAPLTDYTDQGFAAFRYDGVIDSGTLPSNPATGLDYSALSAGQSEIVPAGVSTTMPAPAPWQRTLPNEGSLASKTPTPAVRPVLAADALPEPAGPAPVRVLLSAAVLAAFAVGLVFARRPRLKVYRRRH